jgi:hypothetical protein
MKTITTTEASKKLGEAIKNLEKEGYSTFTKFNYSMSPSSSGTTKTIDKNTN